MLDIIKLVIFYNKVKKDFVKSNPFLYNRLNELDKTSVDRQELIIEICKGKKVLHFGFLDSPLLEERLNDNALLHQIIRQHARFLYGADIDEDSLQKYREITGDYNNLIVNAQNFLECPELINDFELVLFPEVLEHVLNPGIVLTNLKELCALNSNAKLCITVPNAFSIQGFVAAMNNFEYVHPDHYYYFSPVTLKKLLTDCGFNKIDIKLYGYGYMVDAPALTKNGVVAICES